MRPEDFQDRPTVNPTTKRLYAYGQMLFGAVTATATIVASVYAFLGNYITESELKKAIELNNIDIVDAGKALPHEARFSRIEKELEELRASCGTNGANINELHDIDVETLKHLARYIAASSEPNPKYRTMRAQRAQEAFEFYIARNEKPLSAFRLAMRPPGSGLP